MVGFIYKYENKINHKVYIGQTTDLVNRKSAHRYKASFVKCKFYNAIRKYGWENFEFDILAQVEEATLDELNKALDKLEVQFIIAFDSFHNGYNSTAGGYCYRGKDVSEEYREYCRNRTYSEETRAKMSRAARNRVFTDETRKKLRENALRRNFAACRYLNTENRNAGIRKALAKPVLQINKEGNVVNEFPTVREAASFICKFLAPGRTEGGMENGIHRHCVGKAKKRFYYGFEWKFKADCLT